MATSSSEPTDNLRRVTQELAESLQRGDEPMLADWQARHPELASELERLFQATVPVRARPALTPPAAPGSSEQPALRHVGDYDVVREIGRGGMGIVYEAAQRSLARRVALKVLPLHVSHDAQALERFRREARAAARLHHTNIVPVFEVGHDQGVFFYAMQFIEGRTLAAEIARLQRAPLPFAAHQRRAAQLAEHVAHALAYAHERGTIHRDIKPANLLLDAADTIWVSDFGLAKGSGDNLTASGSVFGTLGFMAPERFHGQCDPRADIYALGVTLYELLLLRPAFPMADHARMLMQVQQQTPPPPCAVDRRVARDLETIILKAIDKEPQHRYQSAAALAEDLRRFGADEPILARPDTTLQRVVRAARRNPRPAALLGVVAVLALALIAGALISAVRLRKLADQREQKAAAADLARLEALTQKTRAENEAQTATELSTFLLGLLEETDSLTLSRRGLSQSQSTGQNLTPLEMLDRAAQRVHTALHDRPQMRANLLARLAAAYLSVGQYGRARPFLDEALALRQQHGDPLDLAESWHQLGYYHQVQHERPAAAAAYEKALAIRARKLPPDDPLIAETLIHLGFLKSHLPEATDGEAMLRRALDIHARRFGENSREYALALIALFQYHYHRGENFKLFMLAGQTEELVKGAGRDNKFLIAMHAFVQGQIEKRLPGGPNYEKAAEKLEKALEIGEPLIGKTHYFALLGRKELAFLYLEDLNKPAEAAQQFRIVHERLLTMNEGQSPEAGYVLMHLGRCLRDLRKSADAEAVLRQAADIQRRTKGDLGRTLANLAQELHQAGRVADAEPVLSECVAACQKSDTNKDTYSQALDLYVEVLLNRGKQDQALASLREHVPELDRFRGVNGDYLFHQARRRGLICVLWPAQPPELRQAELTRALSALQAAVREGFRDFDAIRTHPALAPLRDLPEFAKLLPAN